MPEDNSQKKDFDAPGLVSVAKNVVNDAMAAHNLAPAIKTAITENKPLNDALQGVMVETVERNPEMKAALDKSIAESNAIKKSKMDYRQPGYWIPIGISVIGMIVSILIAVFKN